MTKTSFHGSDAGALAPAAAVAAFVILCLLLALSTWTMGYAEYARGREAAFRAAVESGISGEEASDEND